MPYRERLELLISMKERDNGLHYRSCDEETAHNVMTQPKQHNAGKENVKEHRPSSIMLGRKM